MAAMTTATTTTMSADLPRGGLLSWRFMLAFFRAGRMIPRTGLPLYLLDMRASAPPLVDRQRTGPAHCERAKARQVKQDHFIADRAEFRAVRGYFHQLYREEAV